MDSKQPATFRNVAIHARKIGKTYLSGRVQSVALHELSLEILETELTLISGPSGCGKSTLLAILSGLQQPDHGSVVALGKDLGQLDDRALENFRLRHTGFVFQGFNLFPALTASEQVELPLRYMGLDVETSRQRALLSLEEVGLGNRDAANGQIVIDILHRIAHKHGTAVVCVSHDPRVISHADRVLTMEDGRILSDHRIDMQMPKMRVVAP